MSLHLGGQMARLEGLCLQEGVSIALQCSQLLLKQGLESNRGATTGLAQIPHNC